MRFAGYVTGIYDDARVYANHAKKKLVDLEDIRLAVKMQLERQLTNPPPRDVLLEVAKAKNTNQLPTVKASHGLRLPPDRFCLTSTNYKLKSKKPNVKRVNVDVKPGVSAVKRPATGGLSTVPRAQNISMAKPTYKISTGEGKEKSQ